MGAPGPLVVSSYLQCWSECLCVASTVLLRHVLPSSLALHAVCCALTHTHTHTFAYVYTHKYLLFLFGQGSVPQSSLYSAWCALSRSLIKLPLHKWAVSFPSVHVRGAMLLTTNAILRGALCGFSLSLISLGLLPLYLAAM